MTTRDASGGPSAPAQGARLTRLAVSATLHCLTGCAIGEVLGMVLGTGWGWSDGATVALAVGLAFLFGYALTVTPVLRSGLPLRRAVRVALAADTVSIATMEAVDNAIMLGVPGAAGQEDVEPGTADGLAAPVTTPARVRRSRW